MDSAGQAIGVANRKRIGVRMATEGCDSSRMPARDSCGDSLRAGWNGTHDRPRRRPGGDS
jgi:hypothetical protein